MSRITLLQVDARGLIALSRGLIANDSLSHLSLSANSFAGSRHRPGEKEEDAGSKAVGLAAGPHPEQQASGKDGTDPRTKQVTRQSIDHSEAGPEAGGSDAEAGGSDARMPASEGGGRVRWQDGSVRDDENVKEGEGLGVGALDLDEAKMRGDEAVSDASMISLFSHQLAKRDQERELYRQHVAARQMHNDEVLAIQSQCARPTQEPAGLSLNSGMVQKGDCVSFAFDAGVGVSSQGQGVASGTRARRSRAETGGSIGAGGEMAPCLPRSRLPSLGAWWESGLRPSGLCPGAEEVWGPDGGEDTVEEDKEGEEEVEWGHGAGPGAMQSLARYLSVTRTLTHLGICF